MASLLIFKLAAADQITESEEHGAEYWRSDRGDRGVWGGAFEVACQIVVVEEHEAEH